MCKYMGISKFAEDETVCREGQKGDILYIVYSGQLSVY